MRRVIEWVLRMLAFGPLVLLAFVGVWALLCLRDVNRRMH